MDTPNPPDHQNVAPSRTAVSLFSRPPIIFLMGLITGALLGVIGSILLLNPTTIVQEPADQEVAVAEESGDPADIRNTMMNAVVEQTRHFKGDPDAPITIIEFSDFKCGFCGRFAMDTLQQLEAEYIEKGIVRFGYQSVAFLSAESFYAAMAGECAAEQGAFWDYHDLLFVNLANGNGNFTHDNLTQFAGELGLDTATFQDCLESEKYTPMIRNQTETAQAIGVSGTPTFLVNGQPLRGAQPFEVFQQVIEAEQ